jgi:plasmid maintenance system antidote protein VapI
MHQPAPFRGDANASLAHILAHAIESSDKPKHQIAREVGIHRETLLRVMRGNRPIGLDEAARVLDVCGAFPRASMILALAGQEDLACEWMRSEMGEFLEDFFTALPGQLGSVLMSGVNLHGGVAATVGLRKLEVTTPSPITERHHDDRGQDGID